MFFYWQLQKNISYFDQLQLDEEFYKICIFGVVVYVLTIFNGSLVWYTLMRGFLGFEKPITLCAHIYLVSQFAKYIPGNIGHHVGRVYMVKKSDYNLLQVFAAMTIENILALICSGILSVYVIYELKLNFSHYISWYVSLMGFLLFCVLFLIRNRLLNLFKKYFEFSIRFINIFYAFLIIILNFLMLGFVLYVFIKWHLPDAVVNYFLILGIFAISWLLGFVTPGSPGGIGVREALLVLFLTPLYGEAISVWLSIMLRIITTVGDGLAFLIGMALAPYVNRLKNVNV